MRLSWLINFVLLACFTLSLSLRLRPRPAQFRKPSTSAVSTLSADSTEYDELQKYAHMCAVVYCLKKGLSEGIIGEQAEYCPAQSCFYHGVLDLDIAKTFSFTNMMSVGSGFIALDHASQRITVVFRGTASSYDWVHNFTALPRNYKPMVHTGGDFDVVSDKTCDGCKIHKGFNIFLQSGARPIVNAVLSLKSKYSHYQVVTTGHSLGGALAVLLGVELRLLGHETLVVTLGGPKIGNKNFASFVDDLFQTGNVEKFISSHHSFDSLSTGMIRATHRRDIVPFLPPLRYFHQSGFQYYLSNEQMEQTADSVQRRGTAYIENDQELEYIAMMPSGFSRNDHVNYFFKITGCHDL